MIAFHSVCLLRLQTETGGGWEFNTCVYFAYKYIIGAVGKM